VMFTKPWVMTPRQTQIAAPGDYIRPTMCEPLDKSHLVKSDETPYISKEAGAEPATVAASTTDASAAGVPKMAGEWNVQIFSTIDGVINERWSIKQEGNKISGTVAAKNGTLPIEGSFEAAYLHATITDGDKKYDVRGTLVDKDFDGSIKINRNEFRLSAKGTK
jgi:hypothetical protein